jgi:hypothetical protein
MKPRVVKSCSKDPYTGEVVCIETVKDDEGIDSNDRY